MENCQPKALIATERYSQKAYQLLNNTTGLIHKPALSIRQETVIPRNYQRYKQVVNLEDLNGNVHDEGGMMLYTSGTTSMPVSFLPFPCFSTMRTQTDPSTERSTHPSFSINSTSNLTNRGMEI